MSASLRQPDDNPPKDKKKRWHKRGRYWEPLHHHHYAPFMAAVLREPAGWLIARLLSVGRFHSETLETHCWKKTTKKTLRKRRTKIYKFLFHVFIDDGCFSFFSFFLPQMHLLCPFLAYLQRVPRLCSGSVSWKSTPEPEEPQPAFYCRLALDTSRARQWKIRLSPLARYPSCVCPLSRPGVWVRQRIAPAAFELQFRTISAAGQSVDHRSGLKIESVPQALCSLNNWMCTREFNVVVRGKLLEEKVEIKFKVKRSLDEETMPLTYLSVTI